jgi:selenoprotein W-related protein
MTSVEVEYCVPYGLRDLAIQTQTRLLDEFGQKLDSVTLSPGHGGVFVVRADSEKVLGKDVRGADLDLELIAETVKDCLQATT